MILPERMGVEHNAGPVKALEGGGASTGPGLTLAIPRRNCSRDLVPAPDQTVNNP